MNCTKNIFLRRVPVINLGSGSLEMTNLRTDEMAFSCNLTKIGTDENKAIYSTPVEYKMSIFKSSSTDNRQNIYIVARMSIRFSIMDA